VRLRTIGYLTAEAFASVRDNGLLSMAAVSTVGISLLVLAIITLLALNLQYVARVIDAKVQVVAYLAPSAATQPEEGILQEVRVLPGVRKAVLVTKEQALEQLRSEMGLEPGILHDVLRHNPLPDSIDVYVTDPRLVPSVVAHLERIPGVASVNDQQAVVARLARFTEVLRWVGLFLVAALGLATLVVVGNTVRVAVYARREQIAIMKLVGATNGFIRWPFFIEGALLGLGGAVLAGSVVWWGYGWLLRVAAQAVPFVPLLPAEGVLPRLGEGLVAAGVGLGALGSAVSVHRHLNV
jgi:cell division transport system permease protein